MKKIKIDKRLLIILGIVLIALLAIVTISIVFKKSTPAKNPNLTLQKSATITGEVQARLGSEIMVSWNGQNVQVSLSGLDSQAAKDAKKDDKVSIKTQEQYYIPPANNTSLLQIYRAENIEILGGGQ